eukprot:8116438-Alexandrium_andersonii.AAC.1
MSARFQPSCGGASGNARRSTELQLEHTMTVNEVQQDVPAPNRCKPHPAITIAIIGSVHQL